MGERLICIQEVGSSNLPRSTITDVKCKPSFGNLPISQKVHVPFTIPLVRLIEGFLLSCRVENKSPKTISFYKDILDHFQWYLNKFNITTIDATTIRGFLGYLKDTPSRWDSTNSHANRMVSPTTVKSYYVGLCVLFNWAVREELIEASPMATVKKPKLPHKTIKGLEQDVMQQILNSITGRGLRDLRNKAMLLMFLDTGLRLSELANLTMSDIDFERGIIKTNGKGSKERFARIGVKTQKVLWNYLAHRPKDAEYVWLGKDNNKMATDSIAQMIRKLGKRLGMKLSPHKLRHSFAISFLRNGANPFELQIALGHTTLEMTRRYTQALGFDDVYKRHVVASPVDRLMK